MRLTGHDEATVALPQPRRRNTDRTRGPVVPDADAGAEQPQPQPQPRRRNPDRTRGAILSAATAEFASRGYDGASVNEIAFAANVNKRMLYHYFDSKEGLYLACLEAVYRRFAEMIASLGLDRRAPDDALGGFVLGIFEYVLENPALVRLAEVENMTGGRYAATSTLLPGLLSDALAALGVVLARGEEAGLFRPTDPVQVWMTLVAIAWAPVSNRPTVGLLLGSDAMSPEGLEQRRAHLLEVARAAVARRALDS